MSITNGFAGVSNCYVFKSRLQEYAQKGALLSPVYETTKEGPSHEPSFRSTVTVNNVSYDSLPGFSNRKAAEQSAAEVALMELAKSGNINKSISHPVQETGLCKNLLQEYAQKMNYAIPSYVCRKDDAPGRMSFYSCTVDIGGIQYIGAAARTKKEAEIKAARTALLAIQSNPNGAEAKRSGSCQLTVLPSKREPVIKKEEKPLKPTKGNFKKKGRRNKSSRNKIDFTSVGVENPLALQVCGGIVEARNLIHDAEQIALRLNQNQQLPVTETHNYSQHGQTSGLNCNPYDHEFSSVGNYPGSQINDLAMLAPEVETSEVGQLTYNTATEVPVMVENFGCENSSGGSLIQYEDSSQLVAAENAHSVKEECSGL